jgi:hypothetical protein
MLKHVPLQTEQISRQENEPEIIAEELVKKINTKMLIRAKINTA